MKCNKENTSIIDSPEFVILELIDNQIMKLEDNIKDLERLKNNIYNDIQNELSWRDIYMKRLVEI